MAANEQNGEGAGQRRHFLRDSLKASMPLLMGWLAGHARGLAHAFQAAPSPRKTSPPPAVASDLPPGIKESLDRQYEEFARDNPEHDYHEP